MVLLIIGEPGDFGWIDVIHSLWFGSSLYTNKASGSRGSSAGSVRILLVFYKMLWGEICFTDISVLVKMDVRLGRVLYL